MRKTKIHVYLNEESIQEAIDAINANREWVIDRSKKLAAALAQEGVEIARLSFEFAQYDGTNDVQVQLNTVDSKTTAIVATGFATLFIEFGTGVQTYPDDHPLAHEMGMIRGEYGKGHGKQVVWGYFGDPGTNGFPSQYTPGLVFTRGNPANQSMYKTGKYLEYRIKSLVGEIFT